MQLPIWENVYLKEVYYGFCLLEQERELLWKCFIYFATIFF